MPNRTLSFAYTACALFAVLTAFLFAMGLERLQYVLEKTNIVWISENDGSSDNAEVAASVQKIAEEHGTVIGYAILDVQEPSSVGHLYLALPGPESRQARWLEEGYPNFDPGFTVVTHPLADFADVGPNGYYLVFGSAETEAALRTALAEHGLHEAPGTQTIQPWDFFLAGGYLFNLLAVALLGSATAAGAGVLLGARDYGVNRLQGRSYLGILLGDLRKVARLAGVMLPVVAGGTLTFLGFYNGWNQLGLYTLMALAFLVLLAIPCLLVHAAFLGLVNGTGILPSLKGRLPVRSTTAAVYLVRVPVLVLALVILGGIVTHAQNTRDQTVALELFEEQGETASLSLSANYGWTDPEAVDDELGPWLRSADSAGNMVLASHDYPLTLAPSDPGHPGEGEMEHPLLIVNDTYLAEQEVLSPTGERYGPGEDVRVLIPESLTADTEELTEAVRDQWLDIQAASGVTPEVRALPAADGQTLFTYTGKRFDFPRPYLPLLHEPVVVVLPNGGVLSDSSYVSHMSTHATTFPDPEVAVEYRARSPEASRYLSMVETLSVQARYELAQQQTVLRAELFNLVGAGTVLLLTAMAACVIHVRTRAQEIFARHISGWTFASTHRRLLIVEGAISLAFLGWAAWDTLHRTALASDPLYGGPPGAAPSGTEPFYAFGIVLVCLVITLAALALFHRRIVHEGASQA